MKERRRREAYWAGLRDALVVGRPDPLNMDDLKRVAYDQGFRDGKRAEKRLKVSALPRELMEE